MDASNDPIGVGVQPEPKAAPQPGPQPGPQPQPAWPPVFESKNPRNLGALGGLLMLLGVLWLVAQFVDLNLGALFWPWWVILPGLALLAWGLLARDNSSLGLSIAGSIVTMTGLLLFFQQLTGQFQTWAYAWALVAPGGVALGTILYGIKANDSARLRDGTRLLGISAAIFAVGFLFFEVIIGLSGFGLGFWAWPSLLIVVGVGLFAYGYLKR